MRQTVRAFLQSFRSSSSPHPCPDLGRSGRPAAAEQLEGTAVVSISGIHNVVTAPPLRPLLNPDHTLPQRQLSEPGGRAEASDVPRVVPFSPAAARQPSASSLA